MLARLGFLFLLAFAYSPARAKQVYSFKSQNQKLTKELTAVFGCSKMTEETAKNRVTSYLRSHHYYLAQAEVQENTIKINKPIKWEVFFKETLFTRDTFYNKS